MKVQLDTKRKIIKLENDINLGEFFTKIKKLLPKDWKEFKLETSTVINSWSNPIIIRDYPKPRPYWDYPYYINRGGTITDNANGDEILTGGSDNYELRDGTYNLVF